MLYYNNEIYYGGKVMEKKLLKRSLSFAMMIAVVFSTIIASSFIKANAAETEKAVTLTQGENTSQQPKEKILLNTIQYRKLWPQLPPTIHRL